MIGKDLVAASATPLILSVLREHESYGYEIIRRVIELSAGQLRWSEGMVYPALRRLEQRDLLASRWISTEAGRRRKYYRITKKGLRALDQERKAWLAVNQTLAQLWEATPCPA